MRWYTITSIAFILKYFLINKIYRGKISITFLENDFPILPTRKVLKKFKPKVLVLFYNKKKFLIRNIN